MKPLGIFKRNKGPREGKFIGSKLCIKGAWDPTPVEAGRKPIILLPLGTVFGNGYHPSTRMFLEDLEKLVRPGDVVADIGTGSGILAIAAARLGARKVYATDLNQKAVDLARENVKVNGLESTVVVERGAVSPQRVDLVLCNIGDTVVDLFGLIGDVLKPGGLIVLTATEVAVIEAEASVIGSSKIKSLTMPDGTSYMVLRKQDG